MNLLRNAVCSVLNPVRAGGLVGRERQLCLLHRPQPTVSCASSITNSQHTTARAEHATAPVRGGFTHLLSRGYKTLSSFTALVQPSAVSRTCFLAPSATHSVQVREYKVRRRLRKRCPNCYFEKRKGRWFIECKVKPRHKQMEQMPPYKLYGED